MRNARNHRRRSRSKDKDYHRRSVTALADARKTISVFAFAVGALLVVFLWAWLQAHGVRGPWARAVGSQGSGQEERWAPTGCERIFCCEHMNVFSAPLVERSMHKSKSAQQQLKLLRWPLVPGLCGVDFPPLRGEASGCFFLLSVALCRTSRQRYI